MKHSYYRARWSPKSKQRSCSCLLALLILWSPSLQSVPQLHEVPNLIAFFKSLLLRVLSYLRCFSFVLTRTIGPGTSLAPGLVSSVFQWPTFLILGLVVWEPSKWPEDSLSFELIRFMAPWDPRTSRHIEVKIGRWMAKILQIDCKAT